MIKLAHPIKLNPSWEGGRKWRVYWLQDGRTAEGWTSGNFGLFILNGGAFFILRLWRILQRYISIGSTAPGPW